jgi:hypothetical protein
MAVRIVGVAFVGIGLAVAGGGGRTVAPPAPTPTASDEDRIRDVIDRVAEAQRMSWRRP